MEQEIQYEVELIRHLGRIEVRTVSAAYIEGHNGILKMFDKDKKLVLLVPQGVWGVVRPIPDPENTQ